MQKFRLILMVLHFNAHTVIFFCMQNDKRVSHLNSMPMYLIFIKYSFAAPGIPGITAYRHPAKAGELLIPPSISGKSITYFFYKMKSDFQISRLVFSISHFYLIFFCSQFSISIPISFCYESKRKKKLYSKL